MPVTLVAFDLDETLTVGTYMPPDSELSSPDWGSLAKDSFEPSGQLENRLEMLQGLLQNLATLEPRPALAVLTRNNNKLAARGVLELLHSAGLDHHFDAIWSVTPGTIPKLAYRDASGPVGMPKLTRQGQRDFSGGLGTCKPVTMPCLIPTDSCQNRNNDKENCLKVGPLVNWRRCCQFVPAGWSFVDSPKSFSYTAPRYTKPQVLDQVTKYREEWFPQLLQDRTVLPMLDGLTIGKILLVDDDENNFKFREIELRGCLVVPAKGIGTVDPSDFDKLLNFVTAPDAPIHHEPEAAAEDQAETAVQEEETGKPEPAQEMSEPELALLEEAVGAEPAEEVGQA